MLRYGFAIVGVQKAATSTLSQALTWHPQVLKAPRKEVGFFNRTDLDWSAPPYDDHVVPRTKPQQRVVGDATPLYLWWPQALERMHAYHPGFRLVVVLRDPIERAFSHWAMLRERAPDRAPDWPDVVRRHLDRPLPSGRTGGGPEPGAGPAKGAASVFSRGLYAEQLERGLATFPREQWLVLEFRAMLGDFAATVDRTTDHIGIRRLRNPAPLRHALAGADQVSGTAPTPAELVAIAQRYEDDLARLPAVAGIDVSDWPTRRLLDGTLDAEELAVRLARRVSPD